MRRALSALLLAACSGGSSHPQHPTPATPDAGVAAAAPDAAPAPAGESLATAGLIPDWMDPTADPCSDFFQYACGGLLKQDIPADLPMWGAGVQQGREIEDFLHGVVDKDTGKLGDYYHACMDEDAVEKAGTKPLAPYLDAIAKVKDAKSAAKAIELLHLDRIFALWVIYPQPDLEDARTTIATLDQDGLGLPDKKYYLEDAGNMKDVRTAYQAHLQRLFAILDPKTADQQAKDAFAFETSLAKAQQDEDARRDPHNTYHPTTIAKLPKGFPWKDYFASFGLGKIAKLSVNDPGYYAAIAKLLAKQKPAAVRAYLTGRVLEAMSPRLGKAFVDEAFAMRKVLSGVEEQEPRWRRCVHRVDFDLGQLLAQPYVAAKFGGDAKAQATQFTQAILAAMDVELDSLPWMDDVTRSAAKDKLHKMLALVGYPDQWRQYTFDVSKDDWAADTRNASEFETRRELAKIGKPTDRTDWIPEMNPQTVNAYYEPTLNELVLPAAILQPPYFGVGFHPAVNFGDVAGVAGHEMTHGFDDEGSQYDADGNMRDWWSKATSEQFHTATQCVIDQYSQYEAVPGVKLDGKLSAGENIADIGGVKIGHEAYEAWKKAQGSPPAIAGLSDEQAFYLAYAQGWCIKERPEALEAAAHSDPHSPPEWRVNGVMVDQPGFGDAFSCKKGTPMNPEKSCAVW